MQDRPAKPARKTKPAATRPQAQAHAERIVRIGVTDFKAQCLALIDRLDKGRIDKVVLTKRGRAVAEIAAPKVSREEFLKTYGALKHMITLRDDIDLTAPLDIEFDAEKGILYNK